MNELNNRYNIGISIINNNQGVKKMLNRILKPSLIIKSYKIYNKIRAYIWYYSKSSYSLIYNKVGKFLISIVDSVFNNKYNPIATKSMVNIFIEDVKTLKDISKGLKNEIIILRKTQGHIIDDINALEICVGMAKSEHESLKNVHNNLALDVSDMKTRLLKLEDFETRTLKEKAQNVLNLENEFDEKENAFRLANKLIDTPFKDDNEKWIPSKYLKLSQTLINDDKVNKCVDEIAKVVYFDYNDNDKQVIKDVIIKHINLTK